MSEPVYHTSPQCKKLVDAALKYLQVPHERVIMPALNTETRRCSDVPGVIYALGGLGTDPYSAVEFFDPLSNQWTPASGMPSLRARFGIAVVKRKLYAIGGCDGFQRYRTVEVFDADTNSWTKV